MKGKKDIYAHLTAMVVIIIWGTTFVTTKILLNEGLTPESIFFYRFLMGYLGILCFQKKEALFANSFKDELKFIFMGIFGGSLYYYTENVALNMTLASNVSLIVCTTPLITVLLVLCFSKSEKIGKKLILGSILAFTGMALVVLNGHFVFKVNIIGELLAIIAAISWSFYTLLLRNNSKNYSSLFATRKILFYGMLTITPAFLYNPLITDLHILQKPTVLGNLLFLGFGASLFCFFMWNMIVNRLGAVRASMYIYSMPLVTLVTAVIIIHEKITITALVGAVLIVSGVFLSESKNIPIKKRKIQIYDET